MDLASAARTGEGKRATRQFTLFEACSGARGWSSREYHRQRQSSDGATVTRSVAVALIHMKNETRDQ